MSFFRPTRTVVDPYGRTWEIYVSPASLHRLLPRRLRPPATRVGVEAVSFLPRPQRYRWTTSQEHAGRVVEQVARELALGEIARPLGAVYVGAS